MAPRKRHKHVVLRARARRLLLLYTIWLISVAAILRCFRKRPPAIYTGNATWMSEKTVSFSARWRNHKYRNVIIYTCLNTRKVFIARQLVQYFLRCPSVFYEARYEQLFSVPGICLSSACLRPLGKAHFVYAEFVLQTFDAITSQTISPAEPTAEGKIAVLVEPRQHPLLEYTIKQVMTTLGQEWSLQLFLSSANVQWLRSRLHIYPGGTGANIVITPLSRFGLDDMSKYGIRVQSAFSAHEKMYTEIKGEHVLWFQVDVIMRSQVRPEWLRYAYVGAEWPGCEYPTCSPVTCSKICAGGNSGLSLRRKSKLLQVATRGRLPESLWGHVVQRGDKPMAKFQAIDNEGYFASDHLHDNSETQWYEDDLQISYKLSKLSMLPPTEVLPRFAIDQAVPIWFRSASYDVYNTAPAGMHKPWLTPRIAPEIIMQLLQMPYERAVVYIEVD